MIVVKMRDQHRVDARGNGRVEERGLATQVGNATAKQRVGEQAHALQLDQDGGMTQENDTVPGRARAMGRNRAMDHS